MKLLEFNPYLEGLGLEKEIKKIKPTSMMNEWVHVDHEGSLKINQIKISRVSC